MDGVLDEAFFRRALEAAGVGVWEWDVVEDRVRWSSSSVPFYGRPAEVLPRSFRDYQPFIHPDERESVAARVIAALKGPAEGFVVEHRIVWPDGSSHWLEAKGTVFRDAAGQARRVSGVVRDVTERVLARMQLERTNRALRTRTQCNRVLVDASSEDVLLHEICEIIVAHGYRMAWVGFGEHDAAGSVRVAAHAGFEEGYLEHAEIAWHAGSARGEGPTGTAIRTGRPDACRDFLTDPRVEPWREDALRRGYRSSIVLPFAIESGEYGALTVYATEPGAFDEEETALLQDLADDLSFGLSALRVRAAGRRAEEALRATEERLRDLTENIREVVWIRDVEGSSDIYVSPAYEAVWGRSCESLRADPDSWWEAVHPDDRERLGLSEGPRRGRFEFDEEYRVVRPDGTVRWVHSRTFAVRDAEGRVYRVAGVAEDITERRRMEEQLRQSQKMEAVGQLAGGVAHDFNNILAAILMQAQIASRRRNEPQVVDTMLREIERSAERGADLTRQLLQFSRQQILNLCTVDANEVVRGFAPLLSRVLPEHVHLELRLDRSPRPVRADVGMLEQVLMNLALNARDAMPRGGHLVIATGEAEVSEEDVQAGSELPAGRYVVLRVSDDGLGIAPDVLPHIFEPFFTTKVAGRGTGLGLATVFGIVQQHRGAITVTSDEGKGSVFEVRFPAQQLVGSQRVVETSPARARGGNETLLLVEDDDILRRLWRNALEDAGYFVLEAENGVDAWRLFESRTRPIHALVTDVVMPRGVSGRDLAVMVQKADPSVRVVFLSGYSPELAGRDLALGPGQGFLAKPFSMHQLLDEVRACLDETRPSP